MDGSLDAEELGYSAGEFTSVQRQPIGKLTSVGLTEYIDVSFKLLYGTLN